MCVGGGGGILRTGMWKIEEVSMINIAVFVGFLYSFFVGFLNFIFVFNLILFLGLFFFIFFYF